MKKTVIKNDAADPKAGMTFRELEDFVHATLSLENAIFADNHVKIRTTWHGTIKSAQITVDHDEN